MNKIMKQLMPALLLACLSLSAHADQDAIKAALLKQYPQINIKSITPTPIPGVWEVFANGQILYSDDTGNYLFINASLVDTSKKENLTDARLAQLTAVKFGDLPLQYALKQVKGDGSRSLAIFVDPDCPYCQQLQHELESINNVTIYYLLFPLGQLHPNAPALAHSIWCSKDRQQAWLDYTLKHVKPTAKGDCDNPLDKIAAYGDSIGVNGTPTLVFENGQKLASYIPAADLEKLLKAAALSKQ